jgi:hypothetical protein
MGKSISAVLILGLVGICVMAATAPARSDRTAVVCFNKPGDAGNGFIVKPLFRTTPRKCNIVHRRQPPTSSDTIQARHLHWSHWGRDRARGEGQALVHRIGTLPIRVRLYRPVHRCGHRVFSKGHFTYPTLHASRTMKLHRCAH